MGSCRWLPQSTMLGQLLELLGIRQRYCKRLLALISWMSQHLTCPFQITFKLYPRPWTNKENLLWVYPQQYFSDLIDPKVKEIFENCLNEMHGCGVSTVPVTLYETHKISDASDWSSARRKRVQRSSSSQSRKRVREVFKNF